LLLEVSDHCRLNAETKSRQRTATIAALIGIGPKDELKECSRHSSLRRIMPRWNARRGMIDEQTLEGRRDQRDTAARSQR
jgi:hypothetical protein